MTMMMVMTTAALAGCAGSDVSQEDVDAAYDNGYADGAADNAMVSTLDTIMNRGSLNCGVKTSQFGMGYLDADTGTRSGLDVAYCEALGAALGVTVTYVDATQASTRFEKLASEEIDVLIRTTTWTTSRDAGLNADFAGINFFDGQGVLVAQSAFDQAAASGSVMGLDGVKICVGTGTTTEGNLLDYFSLNGIAFEAVNVEFEAEAVEKIKSGECEAFTGDMSAVAARKYLLDQEDNSENALSAGTWIAAETMSKEPLGAATRDNDDDWNDVVAWVWYAMVTAEEYGITSTNYESMATAAAVNCELDADGNQVDEACMQGNAKHNVLLNTATDLDLGTATNPLGDMWVQAVLGAVGNYGEAYDDAFCDGSYDGTSGSDAMVGCLIDRAGTANALVSEGGLQYAPPIK